MLNHPSGIKTCSLESQFGPYCCEVNLVQCNVAIASYVGDRAGGGAEEAALPFPLTFCGKINKLTKIQVSKDEK